MSTLTIKGQVTVPKQFRDRFGWKPGDAVDFEALEDGVKIVRRPRRAAGKDVVAKLRRANWDPKLTTDALLKLTRS